MTKKTAFILIGWNLVLSALVAWGLMRTGSAPELAAADDDSTAALDLPPMVIARDTGALKESHIAYFRMDSLSSGCDLFKDKNAHLQTTVRNLEANLQREQDKARKRYEELMAMDAYSTQADREKNEIEMQDRMKQLQEMQADAEGRISRLENETLSEVAETVNDYLKQYNATAGFDFIFSIQGNGQIWVGNEGLNITDQLVSGLNASYRASKTKK